MLSRPGKTSSLQKVSCRAAKACPPRRIASPGICPARQIANPDAVRLCPVGGHAFAAHQRRFPWGHATQGRESMAHPSHRPFFKKR
jgi:hypothetical protein